MHPPCRSPRLLALALLACVGAVDPAHALHKEAPQAIRVTSGASHVLAAGRSWGWYLAFTSPVDLIGDGVSGTQIYLFSLLDYACQRGRPDLRPVTETTFPPCPDVSRPYLVRVTQAGANAGLANPTVDESGTWVAFEAYGRFHDSFTGPAANRRQIFLRNLKTGELRPVTGNPDGDSTQPSLNGTGNTLVFQSTANLLGTTAGISQVYVYRIPKAQLAAVTRGAGDSGHAMTNQLGALIVFESRAALRGDGHDTGIRQLFLYDVGDASVLQLTDGNADSRNARLDEKRQGSVVFESDATDLPGTAGGPGTQVYRVETRDSELPLIEQYTFGPGNASHPSFDPNGNRVLFVADGDLLQNGTTGARLFALDVHDTAAILYQITGRGSVIGAPSASLGTWFAAFVSTEDVSGDGICGQQIFVVDYDPSHYIVAGKQRLVASQLGQLPYEPFPGDANASCWDGDPCTADTCTDGHTCANAVLPDGTACADGDVCTGIPICQAGDCVPQAGLVCDDADACTDDVCDPQSGCGHTAVDCDDADPCTDDTCDAVAGCVHTPLASFDGVSCQQTKVASLRPATLSTRMARKLDRASTLTRQAGRSRPRRARKRLVRATRLLEAVAADVAIANDLPRTQRTALVGAIEDLITQIKAVLADLTPAGGRRP